MALRRLAAALGGRLALTEAPQLGFGRQLAAVGGQQQQPQRRGMAVAVDVQNNNVDKALRQLKRKLLQEGLPQQWKKHEFHIRPSEQRKLDATETQKRLQKRAFKEKIRWILKRKARGF